jgi:hypothetical protein
VPSPHRKVQKSSLHKRPTSDLRSADLTKIQFDPKDERSGTKGLKILSYAPEEML